MSIEIKEYVGHKAEIRPSKTIKTKESKKIDKQVSKKQ